MTLPKVTTTRRRLENVLASLGLTEKIFTSRRKVSLKLRNSFPKRLKLTLNPPAVSTVDGDPNKAGIELEDLRANVLESIEKLGTQPDLILIHNPFVPPKGKLVEFWKILEDMKDKGELTASLGVSNFRPQDFNELLPEAKYKPVCNQLEYHPYVLTHLDPILEIQKKHGILVEAYGPLSPLLRHKTGGPIKPILERIAKRLSKETGKDVDAAAALLLWTRAKGVIAVTASGNEGRIQKLAQTQELPDLTKEEVEEIEQAGRKIYYRAYEYVSSPR